MSAIAANAISKQGDSLASSLTEAGRRKIFLPVFSQLRGTHRITIMTFLK